MSAEKEPQIDTELEAENAVGYKVGEKKTINEYTNLDAEDEALNKWKQSFGLSNATGTIGDPNDPRKVVILEMAIHVDGMPPVVYDLEAPGALERLRKEPIVIKEKSKYHLVVKFRVQHEIVTGLKYLQSVKRHGIRLDKTQEVCGSYSPNTQDKPYYVKEFATEEAPSGMLARGTYEATSKFVDDDNVTHLVFAWYTEIKK